MTLHPKVPADITLAPVAAAIDYNLQALRDKSHEQIDQELELDLDARRGATREDRSSRVLEAAVRNVDLHGWEPAITGDACRLRLTGGSVSLDLGLGAAIMRYIDGDDH